PRCLRAPAESPRSEPRADQRAAGRRAHQTRLLYVRRSDPGAPATPAPAAVRGEISTLPRVAPRTGTGPCDATRPDRTPRAPAAAPAAPASGCERGRRSPLLRGLDQGSAPVAAALAAAVHGAAAAAADGS